MTKFPRNIPEGFHEKLSSKVVKMSERKKTKNVNIKSFNTGLIFSRVVYLLSMNQFGFSTLLDYELVAVTTSLLKDTGDARYTSTKTVRKNKKKVEVSF